jgi:alpha-tubulin suppressor-like RCC1 family protein
MEITMKINVKFLLSLLLVLFLVSCTEGGGGDAGGGGDSSPQSGNDSSVSDNTAPSSTSIAVNGTDTYTTSTSSTLTLAATGASEMYITNTAGCGSGGAYETYATSKAWTLGQTNGTATVYVKYKDAAGNESSCINDTIIHDNTVPSSTSIAVNGTDTYTTSTSSTLTLAATGASEMYITNTAGCGSGGAYETYATSKAWTLGQTNATATVYVKYKDVAGNESSCINDTIIHDNTVPSSTSISIDSGAANTSTTSVTLTLAATDASEMYITNTAGCGSGGAYETYATSKAWTLGQTNATATVYVKYKDVAGNESSCINDTIVNLTLTAVNIFAGSTSNSMCAVFNDGTAQCWGDNSYGKLGDGTTTNRSSPVKVVGLSNVVKITSGASHSCALLDDDSVKCWGLNSSGQLGNNSTTNSTSPVSVPGSYNDIAVGSNHTCGIKTTGIVNCWGASSDGSYKIGRFAFEETANGTHSSRNTPAPIYLTNSFVSISASTFNTCGITNIGDTFCWGADTFYRTGCSNTAMPTVTVDSCFGAGITNPSKISISDTGCAIESTGAIVCWGYGSSGQLGYGATTSSGIKNVSTITSATEISAGSSHNCALLSNNTVMCWGNNFKTQMADGTTTNALSPIVIPGLTNVTKIALGAQFSCALNSSGQVWCWGPNNYGNIGDGTTTDRTIPTQVSAWQ